MSTSNNTNSNTTTTLVKWDESKARELLNGGKSLPQSMVKSAPKGAVAALRAERREKLRGSSHLILAQLNEQNFKMTKFDGTYDPQTKQIRANKMLKNGDEVINLTITRKAETAEDVELRGLRSKLAAQEEELKALRLAITK